MMCLLMVVTVCRRHLESQPRYDEILVVQRVVLTIWSLLHIVLCSGQLAATRHLGLAYVCIDIGVFQVIVLTCIIFIVAG